MTATELFAEIYDRLYSDYGECVCPLEHASPFQLLAAVMLSAQCRDERVNLVTRELFRVAPDADSMAALPEKEIEKIIHPCGLSGAKSRNLQAAARMIVAEFAGRVPETMEELIRLPGIGRKSANVLLGNAFGKPGFPVDTHVQRVLRRLGAATGTTPEAIEREVNAVVPPERWCNFSHLLIQHGRKVCDARRPRCSECALKKICARNGLERKNGA